MKKLIILSSLAACLAIYSCNSKKNAETSSSSVKEETSDAASSESPKKYEVKSGIIVSEMEAMNIKMPQTTYFDDFGAKECIEMNAEIMGIKTHTLKITKDGYTYDIDLVNKTGKKYANILPNAAGIDFKNVSDEMIQKMNLKKLGKETFLDKECDKYSINYEKMKMKGEYLVYKNILFKMKADAMGIPTNLVVTKFEENASVPAEKFEIPEGIKMESDSISAQ